MKASGSNPPPRGRKAVDIYTDGACSGNPGPGGWAAILIYRGREKTISGFEKKTTNNKMELLAAIRALECLKEPCSVTLYTDSAYLVNAFQKKWIERWERSGWLLSDKKSRPKNTELWRALITLSETHRVDYVKVAGHANNAYNNKCDKLAVAEIANNVIREDKSGTGQDE